LKADTNYDPYLKKMKKIQVTWNGNKCRMCEDSLTNDLRGSKSFGGNVGGAGVEQTTDFTEGASR